MTKTKQDSCKHGVTKTDACRYCALGKVRDATRLALGEVPNAYNQMFMMALAMTRNDPASTFDQNLRYIADEFSQIVRAYPLREKP